MAEEISKDNATSRIETVIVMALKNEISWKMLDSLMEELTPTLEKSKQVIKVCTFERSAVFTIILSKDES